MSENPDEKSKIIIDEDWKSQVEREREEFQQKEGGPSEPAAAAAEQFSADDLPPASFALLVTTMATQAMAAMGQLPDPMTGKPEVHLSFARYHIDLLEVLEQKTKGNLNEEEANMLEGTLHQLRMMFVHVSGGPEA